MLLLLSLLLNYTILSMADLTPAALIPNNRNR